MMQILLENRAYGSLGLSGAIKSNHADIVRRLIASGTISDLNDESGEALMDACKSGHLEMVKLLLEAGADPLACYGECLKCACRVGTLFTAVL